MISKLIQALKYFVLSIFFISPFGFAVSEEAPAVTSETGRISDLEAVAIAKKRVPGRIIYYYLDTRRGRSVYVVGIMKNPDDDPTIVLVSVADGKIL